MADVTELRMNVAALSRVDPYAKDILETAKHVALYTFNANENEWEKTDVEGALFVYSRNGEPYHSILIMNRLNTNNLVEPVTQGLDLQLQEPFLLYRNTSGRIYGIWFYDKDDCIRIDTVLDKLVKESEMNKKVSDKVALKNKRSSGETNVDICTMLSKAQEDYNSNKTHQITKSDQVTSAKHSTADMKFNIFNMKSESDMPQGVVDFFAKASTGAATHFPTDKVTQSATLFIGHSQQRTAGIELIKESGESQLKPLLQRLMSNPAHTVEHIEKQQRSVTPQSEAASNKRNRAKSQSNKDKHNNTGTFKQGPASSVAVSDSTKQQQGKTFVNQSNSNTAALVENGMSFLRISSPTSTCAPFAPFIGTGLNSATTASVAVDPGTSEQRSLSAPLCSGIDTPQKPALMPPTMFTSSAGKDGTNKPETVNTAALVHNSNVFTLKPELSSTALASSSSGTGLQDESIPVRPEPLTRNQLLQAFTYLLKNDPEFVNKLHEAYVKSFAEMVM